MIVGRVLILIVASLFPKVDHLIRLVMYPFISQNMELGKTITKTEHSLIFYLKYNSLHYFLKLFKKGKHFPVRKKG